VEFRLIQACLVIDGPTRVERVFEILWRETTDSGWEIYDFITAGRKAY